MQYFVIDTHFHIWERTATPIEWIKGTHLDRDFTFEDYLDTYKQTSLIGGIYIEVDSADKERELAYVQNLARQKSKILGIAFHPSYMDYMESQKICGIREVLHTANAPKINDLSFLNTLEKLCSCFSNPIFEACVLPKDINQLNLIAKKFPKIKFVLNHFGNPKPQSLQEYKRDLLELGKNPNIYCKLSPSDYFTLEMGEFFEEIFAIALDAFGRERLLFGSNYPVSSIAPEEWLDITTRSLERLGLDFTAIAKIYKDNAYACYQVKPPIQRFGQIIKVRQEKLQEYLALHRNSWQGVNDAIKKSNIQNYSIYHYGDFLFAYFEYVGEDFEKDMQKIAQDPITQEWWKYTDPCQISLSHSQQWLDIEEVFHLD